MNEQQQVTISINVANEIFKVDLVEEDVFDFGIQLSRKIKVLSRRTVNEPFTSNPEQINENDTFNDSDIKHSKSENLCETSKRSAAI